MKKFLMVPAMALLLILFAIAGYAGLSPELVAPNDTGNARKTDAGVQNSQPKSGQSVVERDKKRYENRKRAEAKRKMNAQSVVERDRRRYENQKKAEAMREAELKKAAEQNKKADAQ
jgi:hypothetical protein